MIKSLACMLLPYTMLFAYILFIMLVGAEMYKVLGLGIIVLVVCIAMKGDS